MLEILRYAGDCCLNLLGVIAILIWFFASVCLLGGALESFFSCRASGWKCLGCFALLVTVFSLGIGIGAFLSAHEYFPIVFLTKPLHQ
jgi:hypothetical protein